MHNNSSSASFQGDPPAAAELKTLRDRKELALVAMERTRMPMIITDPGQPDNPIVLANHAFLQLTGYAATEILGQNCRFLQGPDTNPADVQAIREGIAQRLTNFEVEILNYRKDGSTFWNQLSISPVEDAVGKLIYYFASQKDITARRRAEQMEATERLLLMEVDHRAMNALALVQSVVRQTRRDDAAHFASSVLARVDTIASAHRLLARNGWGGAEIGELVRMETAQYVGKVETSGPPMRLAAKLVQPMALVLHEMVTNAIQHGALSHGDGRLVINWRRAQGNAVIGWFEHGPATEDKQPEPGFGLSIVEGVIKRQLGGTVVMNWTGQGLRAELSLPADQALVR